jgi:two-component system phosphate regulon sensor histidine kinase PhoR
MKRSRMFWRLFLTYGLLLLSAIVGLGLLLTSQFEGYYLRQTEEDLHRCVVLVNEDVRDWQIDRPAQLQEQIQTLGRKIATRITVIDEGGRVLADSDEDPAQMENHLSRPEIQEALAAGESGVGSSTRFSRTLGEEMMYKAKYQGPGTGRKGRFVRVALPLAGIQHQIQGLHHLVLSGATVTGGLAMLLAFLLARRMTRPLQELTRGAERIAAGQYGQKVYFLRQDEIGTLARTFNHMSERLATQFAQLEEDRQQLRTILSSMVEGVVALDAGQRILFANERAAQLLGIQTATAVGRRLWEAVRQRGLQDLVRRALLEPEPSHGELTQEGGLRSLTVQAARLPGSAPAAPPRGLVLVLHDNTELRRLERLRHDFVANVSHELKTPLSVIKACVETLLDGAVDDPDHRGPFLERIDEQANRLHALILDLLSLARIESGEELYEFRAVPLGTLVAECVERHRARAEARRQVLEAVPPESDKVTEKLGDQVTETSVQPATLSPCHLVTLSPITAWVDEEALSQILDNLVDNALKYTPEGGRVWVRWRSEDGLVCLEVQDTGIGIPEHDLPRIFERFYRVDKARSRELGGTGLGLAIVKHLVQAMHGTVRATSRLGQGTTFEVCLPSRETK